MKKFVIILIMFIGIILPVNANNIKEMVNKFFNTSNEVEKFNHIEETIYKKYYDNLQIYFDNIWNLKEQNISGNIQEKINHNKWKTIADISISERKDIDNFYNEFLNHKNDMYKNRILYDDLKNNYLDAYTELQEDIDSTFIKAYKNYQQELYNMGKSMTYVAKVGTAYDTFKLFYCHNNYSKNQELSCSPTVANLNMAKDWKEFKTRIVNEENFNGNKYIKELNDNVIYVNNIMNKIANYSVEYETKKINDFYKIKYGNIQKCNDALNNPIFLSLTPKNGCYYDTYVTPLEVIQVTNGGVLVKNSFTPLADKMAYIVTKRVLVDGDTFNGRFLYKGIYQYTSVLGANKTVRKYIEIDKPNEAFYFIEK